MANPFYVEPANPLQALMLGVQGYDASQKRAKEAELQAARQAASQAISAGGNTTSALAQLLGAGDTQGATVLAALGKSDTTDEIKEYNLDMKQRQAAGKGTVPFGEWKTALKLAGATKINNSVNTGENEYAKVVSKGEAERFLGLQKSAQGAQDQLNSLSVMEGAMKDPNFYSGAGAEKFVLPLRQATAAFGGDPSSAASMETFRAQANKSVIDSMGGSLGAGFSNADRDFVVSQVPNLANTPDGNKTLLDVGRKVAQRKIEIARMARDYAKRNGGRIDAGFDDELQTWAERNPLFPQARARNTTGSAAPAPGQFRTKSGVIWSAE